MQLFPARRKDLFVNFRWLLILVLLLMMVHRRERLIYPGAAYLLIGALFASNVLLSILKPRAFEDLIFDYIIFGVDIAFVSLAMYFCQEAEGDFYLLYFLTIFMSSIVRDIRGSLPIAVVASLLYAWMAIRGPSGRVALLDTRFLIRVPFFFLVAVFSGFLVQQAKKRTEDRETELDDRLKRQDRLAMLGQMAARVAHDIRNPLTTIKGRSQLIKSQVKGGDIIRRHADSIDRATDQINEIVEDILGFYKESKPQAEPLDLNPLVEEVITSFRDTLSGEGFEVKLDLRRKLPGVKGNGEQLRRVFLNLMSNCFEAMQGQGEVRVRTDRDRRWVTVEVKDNGPGISRENIGKIFDPFYSTKSKGTGLGLSIVHKIIHDLNGTIGVESKVGAGTTFTINLPREPRTRLRRK